MQLHQLHEQGREEHQAHRRHDVPHPHVGGALVALVGGRLPVVPLGAVGASHALVPGAGRIQAAHPRGDVVIRLQRQARLPRATRPELVPILRVHPESRERLRQQEARRVAGDHGAAGVGSCPRRVLALPAPELGERVAVVPASADALLELGGSRGGGSEGGAGEALALPREGLVRPRQARLARRGAGRGRDLARGAGEARVRRLVEQPGQTVRPNRARRATVLVAVHAGVPGPAPHVHRHHRLGRLKPAGIARGPCEGIVGEAALLGHGLE
mmetsp:Transcript_66568/g.210718  ORF Transcript_66568/g.210718 Transcript_66568/m.210718 type:complete len:272 (+) Transcript_66568:3422-4237(+)